MHNNSCSVIIMEGICSATIIISQGYNNNVIVIVRKLKIMLTVCCGYSRITVPRAGSGVTVYSIPRLFHPGDKINYPGVKISLE